jgi:hypothetical protein
MPVSRRILSPSSMAFMLSFPTPQSPSSPEPSSCARMEPRCPTIFSPLPMASPALRLTTTKACGGDRRLPGRKFETPRQPYGNQCQAHRKQSAGRDCREEDLRVQWSGFLTPTESGDFHLGIRSAGFARLTVDGKQVAMAFGGGTRTLIGRWPRSPGEGP